MDTDKIKIFGARVRVDGTGKLAELERAERVSSLLSIFMSALLIQYGLFLGKDEGKSSKN